MKNCVFNSGLISTVYMGVRTGDKSGISPLEIGTKNQKFLENLKSAAEFRLIHLILAMPVYLKICQVHCSGAMQ